MFALGNSAQSAQVYLRLGDARKLDFVPRASIDFICTHPPYADIIHYSEGIAGDLSNYGVKEFLPQMETVAAECFHVLKTGKFCAILMGDTRKKGGVIPLSFAVMKIFQNVGFTLKEIIIKEQHHCRATGYWKTNSVKYNFLLLAHEYLFVFKKYLPLLKNPLTPAAVKTFRENFPAACRFGENGFPLIRRAGIVRSIRERGRAISPKDFHRRRALKSVDNFRDRFHRGAVKASRIFTASLRAGSPANC